MTIESQAARFIRSFIEAANDRDLNTVRDSYHPDIVLVASASGSPDAGTFTGRREVLRWFGDWFGDGVIADWRTELVALWEPAEGVVLTRSRTAGRGRASGVPLQGDSLYNGFVVSGGRITRISVASDPDEALRGVGRADLAGTVGEPPKQGASQ